MRKLTLIGIALSLFAGGVCAARAVNAIKSTRLSSTTLAVGCEDEREPVVSRVPDTATAIIITCKATQ